MSAQPKKTTAFFWPTGFLPRLADGTIDVRAWCRDLDEFFNQGLERRPS